MLKRIHRRGTQIIPELRELERMCFKAADYPEISD